MSQLDLMHRADEALRKAIEERDAEALRTALLGHPLIES